MKLQKEKAKSLINNSNIIKIFLYFKFFTKRILQNPFTAYLITFIILLSLRRLSDSKKKNAIKIIVFSHLRWKKKIEILNKDGEFITYKILDLIFN